MIKFIVGGVIVVLSWALAILIGFPLWIPTLITLLVGLVILLIVGVAKLKERRSARELEKALQAQAAEQAASARPDLQHEIAEMQAEFQKAVSALKTSKKGGKKALYALPWYAIIGPPGCGKSTALRNSGLQFPYLSASGGGVRGLGGTRNCDWWMTSEAVILDTAGRWTSEDEDHDEWLGFLDLIKRFRPQKPLNGMIAAVSIGDVGGAREDDVAQLARRIRERIDEVQAQLSLSLPVYVLFTKCDLIPGFVETFGDMSKQERGQVWGFTRALTKASDPPGEYFSKGFDELASVLEHRSLKRMGEERKIPNRELVYGFPQQLGVMKANLQEFVHHLFLENVFKETPLLRGVYFTSGTQEGRPIDRVMSAMAEAFGQPQVQLPAPQVEAKSYFLRDMFAEVVFKDAEVAMRSPEELKRQRTRTVLAAAAIFLFALGISGLPAIAWAMNRSYLSETRDMIDDARRDIASDEQLLPASAIEPLRARAMELEEYEHDGPPLFMQMGMYQGDVYDPVREVYLETLRSRVVGPLLQADAQAMGRFARRVEAMAGQANPDATALQDMYNRMKLHLLLTVPRGEHQPPLDDEGREFIVEHLVQRWVAATEVERHDPQRRQIEQNVQYYVDSLASREDLYFPRSEPAVAGVRGVFNAVPGPTMAVEGIIAEVDDMNCDITVAQLVGRVGSLGARGRVRCAFTKRAWEERVQRIIEEDFARFFGEHWVLGTEPPEDEHHAEMERERQTAELKSYFLQRYVEEWRNFINSLYVVRPSDDQGHMAVLRDFTDGQPQLITRMIRQIDYNVTLWEPEAGGAGAAAGRAEQEGTRRASRAIAGRVGLTQGETERLLGEARDQAANRLGRGADLVPGAMTEWGVRERFEGLITFAPATPNDVPQGQTAQVTPARIYEEQLEFLRDALGFRMAGTNVTNFEERQQQARDRTTALLGDVERDWRERLRTLLMPPIEGPAWVPPDPPAAPAPTPAPSAAPSGAGAAAPQPTPTPTPTPTPAETPQPTKRRRPSSGAWWGN